MNIGNDDPKCSKFGFYADRTPTPNITITSTMITIHNTIVIIS